MSNIRSYYLIILTTLLYNCNNDRSRSDLIMYNDYTTDTQWSTHYYCNNYYININTYLDIDSNNYYYLEFINGHIQTFTTFTVNTGSINFYQKIRFLSNKEKYANGIWTNVIDSHSYTNENGQAYGVIGVWEDFIGDTIKVYAGYTDECYNNYVDSLDVIIK